MEFIRENGTLTIRGLRELSLANAREIRRHARSALQPELQAVEIDLSEASTVDSSGLGALVSLYKLANKKPGAPPVPFRLLNPQPQVQQIIELTRMHQLFEVVQRHRAAPHRDAVPLAPPSPSVPRVAADEPRPRLPLAS